MVTFTEYSLDRHEKKHKVFDIENAVVKQVIPANVSIGREVLEEYYGKDLTDQDYLQLSCVNCIRIVLLTGLDENSMPVYKPILFNQDYYEIGLQEIEVIGGMVEEPIYTHTIGYPVRVPIIDPTKGEF